MTAFVFVGPTLPTADARRLIDAVLLPPAAQGDVYRATLHRPQAIGIIDGYFDHVCSVWHKEILWALQHGIHVYGAASMGALRAAELDDFGMVGVGAVYEAYRSGVIEDDDEVAVYHGPPDSGYRAVTEAMVNVRATVDAAREADIIGAATSAVVVNIAKELHYSDRRWPAIVASARRSDPCRAGELDALERWLPEGRVDRKRLDAEAMLRSMAVMLASDPPPPSADFGFEYTTLFDGLRRAAGELRISRTGSEAELVGKAVLDEVRLAGRWTDVRRRATLRRLALEEARRQRVELDENALLDEVVRLRSELGLVEAEELERWMAASDLRPADVVRLAEQDGKARRIEEALDPEIGADALDALKIDGTYPALAKRALAKRELYASIDACPPPVEAYREAVERLLIRSGAPPNRERAWRELGFPTPDAFYRAAIGEHLLEQHESGGRA
jgi:hypothetical protein